MAVQRSGDVDDPRARAACLESGFIPEMPGGLIRAIAQNLQDHPDRSTGVFFQQNGGAISRVPDDATAFAHRDAMGNLLSSVEWAHGDDPAEHVAWIRDFWTRLEPFTRGLYANDLEVDTGAVAINANYRGNYDRRVEVENRYDPTNLFRLNANVEPAV